MTETVSVTAAERADVIVRDLRESDLTLADAILRSAFDTFTGVTSLFGDKDYVHTRWLADPGAALAAEQDGQLAGTNFVTRWGTVGFFGPLSVRPELWGQGVASRLMEATVALFDRWGTAHAGLFTFAHSPQHHGLYQKFGFWPRFLTPVMTKAPIAPRRSPQPIRYTALPPAERARAVDACRELTATAYEGLDLEREIRAVEIQGLGEVLLLDDSSGLAGMAVCHLGAGTEAGGQGCYVKFGLARPGPGAEVRFGTLLDACESLAVDSGADHVELGVNAGRHEAYAAVMARGYRVGLVGVSMHRANDEGYSRPGTWLVDDWR
ncbi:MAG: GCN5-related N-acetyltransferase [uncultured Acidimicrobiales bacterium]|uniref:GCN5-related N-acetyltransferase n=1 Tax=uncultured Acidimicrobiales bacterium TaxID=310071 RepID=A0A6J4J2U7_9ACTN|nr:MAG: GCN5-related N-acetyltransferase [uncultured Acidimicrobiales bacterium]